MAITPNYSWPTPDDTDNASAGASAIRTLAGDIDTDLYAIDGRVTTLEGSTPVPPGWVSGQYYAPDALIAAGTTATTNQIVYSPFHVDSTMSISALAIKCTAYTSTGTVLVGVYSNANSAPITKLFESSVSVTSAAIFEATVSQILTPGTYWLAACRTSGSFSLTSINSSANFNTKMPVQLSAGSVADYAGYVETGTGTLPTTATPTLNTANRAPALFVKKA